MSKSKGNVVDPLDLFDSHGADALRLYHLFMGPPTDDAAWDTNGVDGTLRFLDRLWRVVTETTPTAVEANTELIADAHRAVEKVTDDIERFSFNTAIPALMTLTNRLIEVSRDGIEKETFDTVVDVLLRLLAPMAPHVAHELWQITGHDTMLALEPWPEWDPELAARDTVTMVVQVNGKVRERMEVSSAISEEDAEALARASEKVSAWLSVGEVRKVIARPPNLINFVVG
jgi:leucyl-tRNA synthetase